MNARLLATIVALCASTAIAADLPSLATSAPDAIVAYAKDRAAHREFTALRDELAKGLAPIAKEGDPKKLAAKADRPTIALAVAQHTFLTIGGAALETISKEERGDAFAQWLIADQSTLEELLTTGAPPSDVGAALRVLFRIWQSDPSSENGVPRRIAVATALEHATPVLPWSEWGDASAKTIDPVGRFAFYRSLWESGKLFACFEKLTTWEMRRVVDVPLYDEDLRWFHESMPERLKEGAALLHSQEEIGNAAHLVPYRDTSPTNGKSVQLGKPFYDGKRLTPAIMLEYGGVCGAVAKFGSFAARAYGVPAQPLGQEGHCALCWKHTATDWRTGNCGGESDWSVSNLHGLWGSFTARGAMIQLMVLLHAHPSFMTSQRVFALTRLDDAEPRKRLPRELDVAQLCPTNVYVWREIAEGLAAREDMKSDDLRRFAEAITSALHDAPQIALDILTTVENGKAFRAMSAKDRERYAMRRIEALAEAMTEPKNFPGGETGFGQAFREVLGRQIWLISGKTSSLGEWPYLAHLAVFNGSHAAFKEWWGSARSEERERVSDFLAHVATSIRQPRIAELALPRLLTLAESDERLRSRTQKAADDIAETYAKASQPNESLRIYRTMILAGERLSLRSWVNAYTEKALKTRASIAARAPVGS